MLESIVYKIYLGIYTLKSHLKSFEKKMIIFEVCAHKNKTRYINCKLSTMMIENNAM